MQISPSNNSDRKFTHISPQVFTLYWKIVWSSAYIGITCSPLPQNNDNLPVPFFRGNCPIVLLCNIY